MRPWALLIALAQTFSKQRGGEDAGFEVGADGDDGAVELVDAQLTQGVLLGGVGPHGVGERTGYGLHHFRVLVDAEDLGVLVDEFQGQGAAEAAQSDDDDGALRSPRAALLGGGLPSQ